MLRALLVVVVVFVGLGLASSPWYQAQREAAEVLPACLSECSSQEDCASGFSCFHATSKDKGCCLQTLKPNETGCVLDEQCKRACESTVCDRGLRPSRCLCELGRHFLFNKCWKKCPDFAHSEPVVDSQGFSRCELKVDAKTAALFFRRQKRQLRSNFC